MNKEDYEIAYKLGKEGLILLQSSPENIALLDATKKTMSEKFGEDLPAALLAFYYQGSDLKEMMLEVVGSGGDLPEELVSAAIGSMGLHFNMVLLMNMAYMAAAVSLLPPPQSLRDDPSGDPLEDLLR